MFPFEIIPAAVCRVGKEFGRYILDFWTKTVDNASSNREQPSAAMPTARAQPRLPDHPAIHYSVHNSERTSVQRELSRESTVNNIPSSTNCSPINEWSAPNSFSLDIIFPSSRGLPAVFESSFPTLDGPNTPPEGFHSLKSRVLETFRNQPIFTPPTPAARLDIGTLDYLKTDHPWVVTPASSVPASSPAAPPEALGLSMHELNAVNVNSAGLINIPAASSGPANAPAAPPEALGLSIHKLSAVNVNPVDLINTPIASSESHVPPAPSEFIESKRGSSAEPVEYKNIPSKVFGSPLDEFAQSHSWFAEFLILIKSFIDSTADSISNGDDDY